MLKLYIGDDVMDLFEDEGIELNSSIANVNDISKNTTDYAKSFTVPASNNNNRIFKHYYDANIDNAFDARVKVSGRIELDGLPFRYGKWSLEKVILKQGKPSSYSINFVGNLVSLKDKLKNDELSSLDFSAFNHSYDSDTVKGYLQTSGDLIYNLFTKKQLYYRSGSENINTDTLANIAYTGGANTGVNWDLLRPSIRLIKIIEAIESKYNIVFSRDFFATTEFQNLYLWLNNDASLSKKSNNEVRMDITNIGTIGANAGTLDLTEDTFVAGGKRIYGLVKITPSAGYESVPYSVERRLDGNSWGTYSNLTGTKDTFWEIARNTGRKHSWYISANEEFKFTSRLTIEFNYESYNGVADFPEQTIEGVFNVGFNIPKLKIIDFLKGLFSMFKLVVISDDNENLYVDTINNYYALARVWNITRYVKTDTQEVSRGNLLNEIKFNFKEPITLLNSQFKKNTGIAYGDEETLLTDDGTPTGTPLEGEALTISVPFEQFIYERLPDLNGGDMTNIMYGGIFDEKIEPVSPSPHIFYNINTAIGTKTIGYINDSGIKEELTGNINTPSHSVDFAQPKYNLVFGIENNEWDNIASEHTLYSNYYADYVGSIFNIKRRNFKYNAILPLRILLQLKLNDILEIKNNYYRIDNFNLNLLTREISLNLINAFDAVIAGFTSSVNEITAEYTAQTQTATIVNIGNSTATIDDDTWLSVSIVGTIVYFTFLQNNTGLVRYNNVTITNLDTLQTIDIFITQNGTVVTADNGTIKADTNLITADNG